MIELMMATATGSLILVAMLTLYARQRVVFTGAMETLGAFSNASDALSLLAEAARVAASPVQRASGVRRGSQAALFACDGAQVTGSWDRPACARTPGRFGDGVQFAHLGGSSCRLFDGDTDQKEGRHEIDATRWFVREFPATGVPELYCQGRGDRVSQPMVSGIDTLRIRFGGEPAVVSRRASAGAPVEWPVLRGLDICVVARGHPGGHAVSYVDCDGQRVTPADHAARTVLSTWVAIRSGSAAWHCSSC